MEISGHLHIGIANVSCAFKLSTIVFLVIFVTAVRPLRDIENILDLGETLRTAASFVRPYLETITNGYFTFYDFFCSLWQR